MHRVVAGRDGSGGTDVTLATGHGISTAVNTAVTLGGAAYPSPLTITSTGVVAPAAAGAVGVVSKIATNSLTSNGAVDGATGSNGTSGGTGGVGVNFEAGATLSNSGSITGGAGGAASNSGRRHRRSRHQSVGGYSHQRRQHQRRGRR